MKGIYFDRNNNKKANLPKLILVEGVDDAYFLDVVLAELGASTSEVGVCTAGGKDKLADLLDVILKSRAFTSGDINRYAVIRDIDDNVKTCMAEVKAMFGSVKEPEPAPGAIVARSDGRKVGLFLMPDADKTGSLETLALQSVDGHPLIQEVTTFLSKSSNVGGNRDHWDKRRAQAFLSTASLPLCSGVGWATRLGVFDVKSPAMNPLRDFLSAFLA